MQDSNQTSPAAAPTSPSPAANNAQPTSPAAAQPSNGAAAPQAQPDPSPLSYKDMIIEAHQLSRKNAHNMLRMASIMQEVTEKYAVVQDLVRTQRAEIADLKKQLAAIYALTEEGKPLTSENVASKIVEEESKVMKAQLDKAVEEGAITPTDFISKPSDIVWFSYKEGGAGYQSAATFSEEDKKSIIGKKVGDTVLGEATIQAIYALVPKPQPQNNPQPTGDQNDSESQTQAPQTNSANPPSGGQDAQAQAPQAPAPTA